MNRQSQRLSGSSLGIQAEGDVNLSIYRGMTSEEISAVVHNAITLYRKTRSFLMRLKLRI